MTIDELEAGVRGGDRRVLARAITLVESQRPDDRDLAEQLVGRILDATGRGHRVGVTGVPGVGKSTFLEALGTRLCDRGHHVAVLAVDPSSPLSGGSVLGDKTRMERLSLHPNAFVRPSPGGDAHGGVAHHTREALLLCEAAGHDVVFVETIGVGQSETAVAGMVDHFLLLTLAGAGDDLQGIKRGILELADSVAVTKADGDNVAAAARAASELDGALRILRAAGTPIPVLTCSARSGDGLDAIWAAITANLAAARHDGRLEARRREQALAWFAQAVDDAIRARFYADPRVRMLVPQLRNDIVAGTLSPMHAARRLCAVARAETDRVE